MVEVNFEDFPELHRLARRHRREAEEVRSRARPSASSAPPAARRPLRFKRGENHLTGHQALGFSRIRKNLCDPSEDDRDRAARQQMVMLGIREQGWSPRTFVKLPWIAWDAPRTVRSDLAGPGMTALAIDLITTGGRARPTC